MEETRPPIKAWTRPLLTWPEVFFVPLVIGVQLVVFLTLCFIPPSDFYKPPTPTEAVWLLVLNGLVGLPVLVNSCFSWLRLNKYTRWNVACDQSGMTFTTHKGEAHHVPWTRFRGYVVSRRPKKLINILTDDGAFDFAVPYRGFHDVHETTNRLLLAMDPRIPVGGVRKGRDEPAIRVPRWLAWSLVVASVPLFGMPIWVLWLNGFAAVPGLLFELFSRFGGLIWPCILIPPVICFVGLSRAVETKRQRSRDSVFPGAGTGVVRYFPSNKGSSKALQIVLVGFMLFVAFTIAAMRQDPNTYTLGAFMLAAALVLFVASHRELKVANRRVMVTWTHLVVRQGKKEWCWPHGSYSVSLEPNRGRFSEKVHRIKVRHEDTELTLLEQWSEGDWLSRSLSRLAV